MNRYNHHNELSPKALIYRIVISAAALFIVVLYMPRDNQSTYQFSIGKPWHYSQLIAPYDFPIYKSTEEVNREQDSIMKNYEPYFAIATGKEKEQKARLRSAFNGPLKGTVPVSYLPYIEKKLTHIYNCGVMSTEDYEGLEKNDITSIRIFSQNEARNEGLTEVFSHKSAYEYLLTPTGADSLRYDPKVLQKCDLNNYIVQNLSYDKEKSETYKKEMLSSMSYAKGMVMSGQKIIDRGEIINEETYDILNSLEKEYAKRNDSNIQSHTMLLGQLIYASIITICLIIYFNLFRRDYLTQTRSILFVASMPVIFPLITSFLVKHGLFDVYIIPYAMAPIFIRVFMDSRTAFITHVATILLCAIALKSPFEFIAIQIITGLVAIYSLSELSQRSQLVRATAYITLTSLIFYLGIELIHEKDFSRLEYGMYVSLIMNGVLLLFTYPLLFLFEKIFGFTSNVTLVELSNINNQLLQRMSEVAPGTFQHSFQVANLAAEVARKIGAKPQLVRTGALYHDIGKINNPAYFTENQNKVNPHDRLTFEQSAAIVINHVKEGLKLAEKHNLPQVIKDFIITHHGKGKTKYFLISYKNQNPNLAIDETAFTYPGPNPFTTEQAILMMADAVEAASRSLNEYTEESISALVDRIIDTQVSEGFFQTCPITFYDINLAKDVFKERLKIIYHTRISYPELKKKQETT